MDDVSTDELLSPTELNQTEEFLLLLAEELFISGKAAQLHYVTLKETLCIGVFQNKVLIFNTKP